VSTHPAEAGGEIGKRKAKHIDVCVDRSARIEGSDIGWKGVRFFHEALPELSEHEVDTTTEFLGHRIALPLLISCMTGGSAKGFQANKDLARAAQQAGIPVGLGSIRVLFSHPELIPHFAVKALAPDVPVLANIGGVQVRDTQHRELLELCRRLEVQALVVHLNPGQEIYQPGGDRDFRGIRAALLRLCQDAPLPIIVKETGFGIRPALVGQLLDAGAAYVDLAGAGGTNWILVEAHREAEEDLADAMEFADWGMPTSLLLASLGRSVRRVIASGGLRTGMDVAKAVAMGADLAALALPFIRTVIDEGTEGAIRYVQRIEKTLRAAMVLTTTKTVAELQRAPLWFTPEFRAQLREFQSQEDSYA
jgi:isopentenyl-diphosphate delta-isomerase type 2